MRCYNRYSCCICDLFPLMNLCLVVTLLTRDVGIHIWTKLKKGRILRYGSNPPRNPQHLWDQVVEIRDDLAQDHDYCFILVDSMPRRCQAVIDAGGMWTKVLDPHVRPIMFVCFKSLVFLCFVGKKTYFPIYIYIYIYRIIIYVFILPTHRCWL